MKAKEKNTAAGLSDYWKGVDTRMREPNTLYWNRRTGIESLQATKTIWKGKMLQLLTCLLRLQS